MILIALGSNLRDPQGRSPQEIIPAALQSFAERSIKPNAVSRLWSSAPILSEHDNIAEHNRYINAVAHVNWNHDPHTLLSTLHKLEQLFGRKRHEEKKPQHAARTLDLDILDFKGKIIGKFWNEFSQADASQFDQSHARDVLTLPHPSMTSRAFVLRPMAEIVPNWRHPVTNTALSAYLDALPNEGPQTDLYPLTPLAPLDRLPPK
ncbi:MAG: 2-amino-4-hydroxy-6-hydroxymethyldihydropteridine diphosphokinase [Alphaproteobacteria bacterium]